MSGTPTFLKNCVSDLTGEVAAGHRIQVKNEWTGGHTFVLLYLFTAMGVMDTAP